MSFFLIVGFLVVQVVVGIATGSLALLSDAGHMATDALGLGMALAAIHAASTSRTNPQRTFGLYRLEILAALANAVLLFGVAAYVLYEAAIRLGEDREIASLPVLIVGVLGLVVNVAAFLLLRQGAKESLNVEGAYLEVLSDALGSLGVIVGAIVWGVTGWTWVDPVIGAAIGLFILPVPSGSAGRRCASSCRPRRTASTCRRSGPTWPASPASSTCTTSTCGR